jgi:hypothetical protein
LPPAADRARSCEPSGEKSGRAFNWFRNNFARFGAGFPFISQKPPVPWMARLVTNTSLPSRVQTGLISMSYAL